MQLDHSFIVPVPVEQAWDVLLDIETVAPCMPGASLTSVDGTDFTGTVKVKLGPIGLTYKGSASFVEQDAATRRVVLEANGKDTRGNGTAAAVVTATLRPEGSDTRVDVVTDLKITGKPAQFGRGVMADVGGTLIGQFADRLAQQLQTSTSADPAAAAGPPESTPSAPAAREVEAIDLLATGGPAVAKRALPFLVGAILLAAAFALTRRRRIDRHPSH